MPFRPQVVTYKCNACGWSKIVAPRSDTLMLGGSYSKCPSCSHTKLDVRKSSVLETVKGKLYGALERIVKK